MTGGWKDASTVSVTGVTLNQTSISLVPGAGEGLTATVTPADATNKKVTWKSSNEAVATVDANGIVIGVASGTATITVTTEDGGYTATCAVEVINFVNVTGVTLNKTSTTIAVGASETLTATVTPDNATFKNVTWKSSNEAVATVDANGKVTGVKAGTATITVETMVGNKRATCAVEVITSVTGVTLNKTTLTLSKGASETLTATVAPTNATNKKVTWTSSDPAVASMPAAK